MEYFNNIPLVVYNGKIVRNILAQVKPTKSFLQKSQLYYPYIIKEGELGSVRLEDLAYDYYDDPNDVWILYLTNGIADPYYDVYLETRNFEKYLKKKYGSIESSLKQYIFWRNNHTFDTDIISASDYENVKQAEEKKYWTPALGFNGELVGYERTKDDFTYNTNAIISLAGSLSDSTKTFIIGDKVSQENTGMSGYVTYFDGTTLKLQHLIQSGSGTPDPTNLFDATSVITNENGASFTPTKVLTFNRIIPANEQKYFGPVTLYDFETEQNEKKKNINILDARYKPIMHSAFLELMGG